MDVRPLSNQEPLSARRYQEQAKIVSDALVGDPVDHADLKSAEAAISPFDRKTTTDQLISNIRAANNGKPEVYLSTPITGGDRLYNYLESKQAHSKSELAPEDLGGYTSKVIISNCKHAHKIADELRKDGDQIVEPSQITLPGWDQTKYNANWTDFVSQLPLSKVEVCDGWQLSYGCLLEVRTALDKGIPVVDEHGKAVTREGAKEIVDQAVTDASGRGFTLGALSKVITDPLDTLPLELK